MLVIIISTLVICAAGIAAAYFFGVNKIAWWRRLLGLAGFVLATSLVGFGSFGIASNIAYESAIQGYHEFLNGTVVEATVEEITCTKDGPCTYEYDCDPETVTEYYTDSEGELKSRTKTEWDSCPYATVEYSYHTKDSLGRTTGFDRAFAEKPVEWRIGSDIPGGVPRGAPEAWQKARTALDAGRGLPMTTTNTYTNYILASDSDLLKESSDDIETLLEAGLLPEHTQNMKDPIMDTFSANKVNFVGFTPKDEAAWQESVMQFNAALGMERRGDLHLVVVKDSSLPSGVSNNDYARAVKAHWLTGLDKYAISKNGIIVVIGIDDRQRTVEWARASTGMPIGNGSMLAWIEMSLENEKYTLANIMGETYATVKDGEASYVYGQGLIPQAIMVEFPFERACMECDDEGEGIGFSDLPVSNEVEPWGYILVILIQLTAAMVAFYGLTRLIEYYREDPVQEDVYDWRYGGPERAGKKSSRHLDLDKQYLDAIRRRASFTRR